MGTDIHMWVERATPYGWEAVGVEGEYYDGARSIPLFALLADVRISSTWDYSDSKPIAEPRGLPDDLSETVANYMGPRSDWDGSLHSHSWYTLGELLLYDWPENLQGFVENTLRPIHEQTKAGWAPRDVRIVIAFDN